VVIVGGVTVLALLSFRVLQRRRWFRVAAALAGVGVAMCVLAWSLSGLVGAA
jgi:hypothetical protein